MTRSVDQDAALSRESTSWTRRRGENGRAETWAIDLGLAGAAIAAVLTRDVVLWFHLIFVLVVVAALELPFRQFVLRLTFWSLVSSGLVVWAVRELRDAATGAHRAAHPHVRAGARVPRRPVAGPRP